MNNKVYIVNKSINNMINNNMKKDMGKILNAIERNDLGLSISDIQRKTKIQRCRIRIALAYLLGSEQIKERPFGMAKVYTLA